MPSRDDEHLRQIANRRCVAAKGVGGAQSGFGSCGIEREPLAQGSVDPVQRLQRIGTARSLIGKFRNRLVSGRQRGRSQKQLFGKNLGHTV